MNDLKIIFYDVEHGSCTHIITPNGKHILVDVGSKSDKSIVDYICNRYFNGRNGMLDALVITHPHEDHIYDLPRLLERLHPKVLYRPIEAFDIEPSQRTPVHIKIADVANRMNVSYNNTIQSIENICNPQNVGGVNILIIPFVPQLQNKKDLNTYSSVIVLEYKGFKFILTGDNPKEQLQYMIDNNYYGIKLFAKDATILLAPHHGRTGEFCNDFFRCVNPIITVVSDKSVEHATQEESSSVYRGRGANLYGRNRYVLTTRNDGSIVFSMTDDHCTVLTNTENY